MAEKTLRSNGVTDATSQESNSRLGVIVVFSRFACHEYRFRRRHRSPLVSSHVIFARVGALPSSQKSWNEGY